MLRHRKFNSCSLQELDREFQESSRRIEAARFEGCGGWRARVAASEAAATAGVLVVALMMTAVLATSSLVISLHTVINGFCSKQIYNATRKKAIFC